MQRTQLRIHKQEVGFRVRKVLAEHFGIGEERLQSSHSLWDDLNADDLDMFEVPRLLEEEFIEYFLYVNELEFQHHATVADVVNEVVNLLDEVGIIDETSLGDVSQEGYSPVS